MTGVARWCFRHKFIVIALWLIALVAGVGITKAVGTNYSNSFSLPNTQSSKALSLLQSGTSKSNTGTSDTIVWKVMSGSVLDSSTKQTITTMLSKVAALPEVGTITSPYTPRGTVQISKNAKIAYATLTFTKSSFDLDQSDVKNVISTAQAASNSNLEIELGGQDIDQVEQTKPSSTEGIGVLAAAIILFITFASLFATLTPLITALMALGVGISVIGLLSKVLSISTFSPTLGALIGLGVGIDYALFIISRHRTGLNAGLSPEEAAVKALDTAGRAVLFAGSAVSVALLGLLILRIGFLSGVGIAAAVIVVVSVLAASTLMPALFGVFKMKILSRRQRKALAKNGFHEEELTKGIWARNAALVQKNPIVVALLAVVIIGVLVIPYFSLRLGSSDASNDPASTTTYKSYELLAQGFGAGFNGPLLLVGKVTTPSERTAFAYVATAISKTPGVADVQAFPLVPGAEVGTMQVFPTTSPESAATADLISHLRKDTIPEAEGSSGLQVYVGGANATFIDFASVITSKLPLFLVIVIGFEFLILMLAFRSIVIPITAAVMNILAAGAAFGVLVAVFQYGWGAGLLHTGGPGPVDAFVPVLMLAILFGLSMDYEVFLVSRMHEAWVHTKNNKDAVRIGQAETGRVVTAAASIMILVFGSFIFGGQRVIGEFGIGLASSVLIDAFVLRNFLVPAIMHLLGKSNWYLPKWLDKILPHLSVEPVNNESVPLEK
jgi:RND superfamily putative drug exporter